MSNRPLYLEATIKIDEETKNLRERASSVIDLPQEGEKQIDLMYFTAIFVSSGENLNHAFFESSEMLGAEGTIINKALDIEHKEKEIIGHLYDRVFIDESGSILNMDDLKSLKKDELDKLNMHVAIAGIIYKNRFPDVAQEVAEGKWKVSMEAYYRDFDLKIGDLKLTRKEAELMGLGADFGSAIGKIGKVYRKGKEIASGTIARILRDITFSGCGIVENPANPPSVILEVAEHKFKNQSSKEVVTFNMDIIENKDNKLTSTLVEDNNLEYSSDPVIVHNNTVGICVNYKKKVEDKEGNVVNENWCSKFDTGCTAPSREATSTSCLRNKISSSVAAIVKTKISNKKVDLLLKNLESAIEKISK
jgi:hypothetical protein